MRRCSTAWPSSRLVDADADAETQRNILVAPFWRDGDDTQMLATELERTLGERALGLPAKFGFAVDCGERASAGAGTPPISASSAARTAGCCCAPTVHRMAAQ